MIELGRPKQLAFEQIIQKSSTIGPQLSWKKHHSTEQQSSVDFWMADLTSLGMWVRWHPFGTSSKMNEPIDTIAAETRSVNRGGAWGA